MPGTAERSRIWADGSGRGRSRGPAAWRRPGLTALVGAALAAASVLVVTSTPAQAATAITVNGASGGRALDGIGAVSGGGGNSRLLIDYPEPQRTDILNYLFRPGFGAALQILKVEIGGGTQSTSRGQPRPP